MDKFGRSTSGRLCPSLDEQQDSPPTRPRRSATAAPSGDVRNAGAVCRTKGGKHVSLPPLGARTRQSAHIKASRAPVEIEATPIPPPLRKPAPPGFGKGDCATIKASIDAAARANSSDDDDDDDAAEYSYFGELPNPDPEDLSSPRDVCGDFIPLFVGSRKSQAEYPKARKIKIFYEALTVEKKDILGCKPP